MSHYWFCNTKNSIIKLNIHVMKIYLSLNLQECTPICLILKMNLTCDLLKCCHATFLFIWAVQWVSTFLSNDFLHNLHTVNLIKQISLTQYLMKQHRLHWVHDIQNEYLTCFIILHIPGILVTIFINTEQLFIIL